MLSTFLFQSAESHPICGRLKLTELTPIAWTRLTKYKMLVEGLIKQFVAQSTKVAHLTGEAGLGPNRACAWATFSTVAYIFFVHLYNQYLYIYTVYVYVYVWSVIW